MLTRFNRTLSKIVGLAMVCCYPTLGLAAGPSEPAEVVTFRSSVNEVRLVFFAKDDHNHPVAELQKNDFAVIDDERVIRDFRSFNRSSMMKLDIVVLIDSSESVLPQFKKEMGQVLQLISHGPWSEGDSVSVVAFSGMEARVVCEKVCDSALSGDHTKYWTTGGATPLFDAVELATKLIEKHRRPDVWPVLVIFSDGDDTISNSTFKDALHSVRAVAAQVYAIDLGRPGLPTNGTATLQNLAYESGGRWIRISDGASTVFNSVIDDLHSAHVVTYKLPESVSEFHQVQILPTRNLKLQFRCRRGYYSTNGTQKEEGL